jgi:hypothetical protein
MSLPTDYNKALAFVTLSLVAKQLVSKFFIIRVRVANALLHWNEDPKGLSIYNPILQILMLTSPYEKGEADELINR